MRGGIFDPMGVSAYEPIHRRRPFGSIRVGVIMDDFSLQAWGYEFTTVEVTPKKWREQVAGGIDLLFVESAWNGNRGAWQYQLTGSKAPSAALRELVAFCQQQDIPTVFWNKEDPPHFEDFLDTAKLFDVVFTSDSNKIQAYRDALGHDRVDSLSFAAQPAIHNPIRMPAIHQRGDIAFAGMYFAHKYPERREQMELLLGAADRISPHLENGLTIYSRFAGGDERYQFPEPFNARVVGSLPYDKMLTAYRAFKVFLNVNSVTDSPSMCARRVFEITASGTPVVTARSEAIPQFFPQDEVPVVDEEQEAAWMLRALVNSHQVRDRMVHRAQRRIWNNHTYTHRAAQVLGAAGIDHDSGILSRARVTALVSTNRPHQLDHVLTQMAQQEGVQLELALLTHGFEIDETEFRAKARDAGIEHVRILTGEAEWTLGECLNSLVNVGSGDYMAKIDDDDIYGPHYLHDQVNALKYSGAQLVGKQASYLYLGARDMLVLRNPAREHRWTTFVAGPTLVAPADVLKDTPFANVSRGEDTRLLQAIADAGGKVYSADRFNFVQVRSSDGHTWNVDDAELLANGRVESFGLNEGHVLT